MTDQTESDGLDHTRVGVPEGRLLHASPILPAKAESEHAELLEKLQHLIRHTPHAAVESECLEVIHALEAKVYGAQLALTNAQEVNAELRADRDRLAGEVERLSVWQSQAVNSCSARGCSTLPQRLRDSDAQNDELAAEVARLTSELAAARDVVQAILTAVPFSHINASLEYRARNLLDAARSAGGGA